MLAESFARLWDEALAAAAETFAAERSILTQAAEAERLGDEAAAQEQRAETLALCGRAGRA